MHSALIFVRDSLKLVIHASSWSSLAKSLITEHEMKKRDKVGHNCEITYWYCDKKTPRCGSSEAVYLMTLKLKSHTCNSFFHAVHYS